MTKNNDLDLLQVYIKSLDEYPLLNEAEEKSLAYRVQAGDMRAKRDFINSNLRLVINIARRYQGNNVALMDLIQEGNIGLQRAVEKFDPAKGYRFSTYAVPWINQACNRGRMRYGRNIRLPFAVVGELRKFKGQVTEIASRLGHDPSMSEIAQAMGLTVQEVEEKLNLMHDTLGLDKPVRNSEGENMTLGDALEDPHADTERDALEAHKRQIIGRELATLSERDREIIARRYGIAGYSPQTLEDIGQVFGMTRERVRQLESRILDRLSQNDQMRNIR